MPFITSTAKPGTDPVNIYYEVYGTGKPVIFIHGWPLSGSMWEYQVTQLSQQGIMCIAYDRRGFGKSDRPATGYDYDTLAADLHALIESMELTSVSLVGFSMGGGEIARYFTLYGGERIAKVVLVSAVVPYMLQTDDNPYGVAQEVFDEMTQGMIADRPAFMESFNKDFFGVTLINHPVSAPFLANSLVRVMDASPIATLECAKSFSSTDFRQDVLNINVPTLVIHGDDDQTVPAKATGEESARLIKGSRYIEYEGAPHGLWFTHKDKLNQDLAEFL